MSSLFWKNSLPCTASPFPPDWLSSVLLKFTGGCAKKEEMAKMLYNFLGIK